ncbi:MAG: 30S ribosomal protein S3 [Anaerolineae bacterium]|nr:30S ribosomal protein S3 [Anaerolineae bacterium]
MGRKVHPYGFRLGIIRDWKARWYAQGSKYSEFLQEDLKIREYIDRELAQAGIANLEIERFPNQVQVTLWTARPGIVIGRKGAAVKLLRRALEDMTGKRVHIEVQEVERPELDAKLVAENVVSQLERRISHGRAMKRSIQQAMRAGAEGIKIVCNGRLGGAEMARAVWMREGRVPLQTLRADIDYARQEASTTFGQIGVKVWIYKGEVLPSATTEEPFVV